MQFPQYRQVCERCGFVWISKIIGYCPVYRKESDYETITLTLCPACTASWNQFVSDFLRNNESLD